MDHICAAGMFVVNCAILEVQQDNRLLVNLEYTQFIDEEILQSIFHVYCNNTDIDRYSQR